MGVYVPLEVLKDCRGYLNISKKEKEGVYLKDTEMCIISK